MTDDAFIAAQLRAYVINLDRSPERLSRMAHQLEELSIPFERVVAIDGKKLGELPWQGINHAAYRLAHGKQVTAGEAGCFLSHIKALRTFLEKGTTPYALILEDDLGFEPHFKQAIEAVLHAPDAWDVVKLQISHSGTPVRQKKLLPGVDLVAYFTKTTHAGAYIVNRKAAQTYIDKLLPMHVPYDHSFDRVWRLGLKLRGVSPVPTKQVLATSTIDYSQVKRNKLPWYQRIPTLLYRIMNEAERVFYGISRGLFIPRG